MQDDKPPLRLVGPLGDPQEFIPLPYYTWTERPSTVPLTYDECATALFLVNGSPHRAALLLKVPLVVLNRAIRNHPRLVPLLDELNQAVVTRARSVAIDTLFDPEADARRLEWASTKILSSKIAQSDPFAPAGSSPTLTINNDNRELVFHWRTEPLPLQDDSAADE